MRYTYKIGDTIWHGCRYWKTDNLEVHEVSGWNAEYEPYQILRITPKRIVIGIPRSGHPEIHLDRQQMQRYGLQYHSRFAEYFFKDKPQIVGDYMFRSVEELQLKFL